MVFFGVCLVSCANNRHERGDAQSSAEVPVLNKLLASYYADMSERDWQEYREYFWDDATLTTSWQKEGDTVARVNVTSIDAFIEQTPRGPDSQPIFSERMKSASIQVRDNLATAWVEYDAEFGQPDSLMRWSGTDVFTFLRHDGEWKIVSLVFESN